MEGHRASGQWARIDMRKPRFSETEKGKTSWSVEDSNYSPWLAV